MDEHVILYEHGCPKCQILKAKLDQKNIAYERVTDIGTMMAKGFTEAPKLEVNGVVMGFKDAVDWVKER
jgi:glutaredoxin